MLNEETKVRLAYVAVCILWGSTYIAIRIGVSNFPPALFAAARFLTAGLINLTYCKIKGLPYPEHAREYGQMALVGLFLLCGGTGLVVVASQWVHSGMSSLMIATQPLFMAVLESLLHKKNTLSARGWLGLLAGFGGVLLLVFSNQGTGAIDLRGAAVLLLAAFLWSSGSVYSKTIKPSGSIVSHIGLQMFSAGAVFVIIGLLTGEATKLNPPLKSILAVLYLVFFGSIVAYSCFFYVLQNWPASKTGTYTYVNPVVAMILGALILGEPVSMGALASAAVILGSVYIVQTSKVKVQATGTKSAGAAVRQ